MKPVQNHQVTMGKLAEQLFIQLFGGVQSTDEYDKIKDVVLGNTNIEIKAQNRHPTKDVFAIRDAYLKQGTILGVDNIIKCFNVDRLVFVEYDTTNTIKIWECPKPRQYIRYVTKTTSMGMIGFPISQMTLLHEHADATIANQFRSLSQSSQFRK